MRISFPILSISHEPLHFIFYPVQIIYSYFGEYIISFPTLSIWSQLGWVRTQLWRVWSVAKSSREFWDDSAWSGSWLRLRNVLISSKMEGMLGICMLPSSGVYVLFDLNIIFVIYVWSWFCNIWILVIV